MADPPRTTSRIVSVPEIHSVRQLGPTAWAVLEVVRGRCTCDDNGELVVEISIRVLAIERAGEEHSSSRAPPPRPMRARPSPSTTHERGHVLPRSLRAHDESSRGRHASSRRRASVRGRSPRPGSWQLSRGQSRGQLSLGSEVRDVSSHQGSQASRSGPTSAQPWCRVRGASMVWVTATPVGRALGPVLDRRSALRAVAGFDAIDLGLAAEVPGGVVALTADTCAQGAPGSHPCVRTPRQLPLVGMSRCRPSDGCRLALGPSGGAEVPRAEGSSPPTRSRRHGRGQRCGKLGCGGPSKGGVGVSTVRRAGNLRNGAGVLEDNGGWFRVALPPLVRGGGWRRREALAGGVHPPLAWQLGQWIDLGSWDAVHAPPFGQLRHFDAETETALWT